MPGIRFDACELLPAQRQLRIDGVPVALGSRAFEVLLALVERAGKLVTKDELLAIVWPGVVVEEANVQVQVSALRKLLGPAAIATVPGRGYSFSARLLDEAQPEASSPKAPRSTLPQARTAFIGRQLALKRGAELLAQSRLLTLTGIGGCGKTRLALRLAEDQAARHPGGVWLVDLAPVADASGLASALAAALEVREESGTPIVDRVAAHLADARHLIVLDNCEHLVLPVAALCDELLSRCPNVTILATSRVVLRSAGEQVFPVQPLSLPDSGDAQALAASEAVQLFLNRAALAWPDFADFELADAQGPTVGRICHRLEGIALAIELAAARADVLSLQEIETALDERFRFLTAGSRALARHQTLEATLQWSYDSLSDVERRVLRALSVFAGGWSLASACEICALDDRLQMLDLLAGLNDKSLLVVDRNPMGTRYGMLETVREFAQARLLKTAEADDAVRRHLRWVVAFVEEAGPGLQGPAQGEWMSRLRREQENILAAQQRSLQQGDGRDDALTLAASLSRYWLNSGQLERGHGFARDALAQASASASASANASGPADTMLYCRALAALGAIAFRMGRYEETLDAAERGLTLARQHGDVGEITAALGLLGKGLHATGQAARALPYAAEACDTARTMGITTRLSAALNNLGEVHRGLGHFDAARTCYEEAIGITRQLGYAGGTFVSLCNLVRLLIGAGRADSASSLLLEALALWQAAGLVALAKDVLECSAGLAAQQGQAADAARFAGAARGRHEEAGIRREPIDEAFLAPLLAQARQTLGSAAFDAIEAAGRATSYEAAMEDVKRWLEKCAGRVGS
jgi:predicted ATPase/DNA-binding winged helix-turn-helix (wHTH) protein